MSSSVRLSACALLGLQSDVFKTMTMLIHMTGVAAGSAVLAWQIGTHDGLHRSPDIVSTLE